MRCGFWYPLAASHSGRWSRILLQFATIQVVAFAGTKQQKPLFLQPSATNFYEMIQGYNSTGISIALQHGKSNKSQYIMFSPPDVVQGRAGAVLDTTWRIPRLHFCSRQPVLRDHVPLITDIDLNNAVLQLQRRRLLDLDKLVAPHRFPEDAQQFTANFDDWVHNQSVDAKMIAFGDNGQVEQAWDFLSEGVAQAVSLIAIHTPEQHLPELVPFQEQFRDIAKCDPPTANVSFGGGRGDVEASNTIDNTTQTM